MTGKERRLMDKEDLNKLYELTNPKLSPKPKLFIVINHNGSNWEIEDSHILRGYRACKRSLESKVRRYESRMFWPSQCQIGIGYFEQEQLIGVLIAKNLGFKPVEEVQPTLPLDDALEAIGLSRREVQ